MNLHVQCLELPILIFDTTLKLAAICTGLYMYTIGILMPPD